MPAAPQTPEPRVEFDAGATARFLLRTIRAGALATIDRDSGSPFATLVTVATDIDGSPLILVSALSAHSGNLDADPRASILLAATGKGDPLAHPRLTVVGRMERITDPRVRRRFLARHPKAALYADFPDFGFRRILIDRAHLNGGFARAAALGPDELLVQVTPEVAAVEADALAHMNQDHADSIALYATRLAGSPPGAWEATGLDPEGIDMAAGDLTARALFRNPVASRGELRQALVELAVEARARET